MDVAPLPPDPNRRAYCATFALLAGLFAGLGVFTFHYGEGLSYFSKEPSACVNCHIMQPQFDSWQKASHHTAATCVDCHLPHTFAAKWLAKAENGLLHASAFTFQHFHEPIFIRVRNLKILERNCVTCHRGLVHGLGPQPVSSTEPVGCVRCHRSAGHGATVGLGRLDPLPPLPDAR